MAVIIVILIVISVVNIFHTNPYGESIKIDNFSYYFGGVSQDRRDQIEHNLYELVIWNGASADGVPKSGAMVRDGTATYNYEKDNDLYRGEFVVDIATLKESYKVSFINPSDRSPAKDVSYQVNITCVPGSLQIYDFYNCRDMFTDNVSWGNEYQLDYTFGTNTSYRIRQILNKSVLETKAEYNVAIVDETSMEKILNTPDNQYRFKVDIDGKYTMSVIVRMDLLYGKEYIAMYVDMDGKKTGYLWNTDDKMKNELTDWIIDQSGLQELDITFIPTEDS